MIPRNINEYDLYIPSEGSLDSNTNHVVSPKRLSLHIRFESGIVPSLGESLEKLKIEYVRQLHKAVNKKQITREEAYRLCGSKPTYHRIVKKVLSQ